MEIIIKHFLHEHVLSLNENKIEKYMFRCDGCNEDCDEGVMIYSCRESYCGFNLRESCAKLPQELHNPLLHPHPLSLVYKQLGRFVKCNPCRKSCRGLTFGCDKCENFQVDVKCALIRPAAIEEGEETVGTHHFSHHEHPLLLLEKIPTDRIECRVCRKYCSDPKTYGCPPCGFFLHPSCFKLPQEIFHHFHPYHPLTLKPMTGPKHVVWDNSDSDNDYYEPKCNACREGIPWDKYAYVCKYKNCRFRLHGECTRVIMPAITYEGHDHLLQFNHNFRKTNRGDHDELIRYCSACKSTGESPCESYGFRCLDLHFPDTRGTDEPTKCSACSKSITSKSYAFKCLDLDCDFNLHLTCGPLPSTIKHKSHIHPLILTNSPAQHEDEDETADDEFYCDACEEERPDPLLPIYQCIECHFAADIKCLISEVISSLNGDYGDVELIHPLGQFGKVITKDAAKEMAQTKDEKQLEPTLSWENIVLKTLSEDENYNEVAMVLSKDRIKEITTAGWIEPYDHEEIIMFCDNACTDFMEFDKYDKDWNCKFPYGWDLSSIEREEVVNVRDYMTTRRLAPILNHLLSNYGDIGAESTLSHKLMRSLYFCMLCECIYRMRNTKVVDITIGLLLSWWRCLKILQFAGFKIEFAFDRLKRVTHAHFGLYVEKQVDNTVDQIEKYTRKLEKCTRKLEYIKSAKSSLIEECFREASVLKNKKAVSSNLL